MKSDKNHFRSRKQSAVVSPRTSTPKSEPISKAPAKPNASPHPLSTYFGFCLYKAGVKFRESLDQAFIPIGIIAPQLGILSLLNLNESMSQVEIGACMKIDRASMVKLIDALEAKRYVARKADSHDRRANRIEMTTGGRVALAKALTIAKRLEGEFLSKLTATEARVLRTAIPKLMS